MIWESIIISILIYMLFGDYWRAKAELVLQEVRAKELENDEKEYGPLY